MLFSKIKYAPLAAVLIVLAGCGGGENTPASASANENNLSGIAAAGAPLSGVAVTATSLTGSATVSAVTNSAAFFEFKLDPAKAPYLIEATDASLSPAKKYQALVLENDISASGGSINITPISTMVARIVLNEGLAGKSPADIKSLRLHAAELVKKALAPLLDEMNVADTAEQLLTRPFIPTQDALDKMLDTFSLSCEAKICRLTPLSTLAQNKLGMQDLLLDVSSLTAATASAAQLASQLETVKTRMSASAPVVVVFSAADSGATAGGAGASYAGKFAIYNFSDAPVSGGARLSLESGTLNAAGFSNVTATVHNGKFSFQLPDGVSLAPLMAQSAPASYVFGFTGQGAPAAVTDLHGCSLNGKKCLVLMDDGKLSSLNSANAALKVRSWVSFLATLPVQLAKNKPTAAVPPPTTIPSTSVKSMALLASTATTTATTTTTTTATAVTTVQSSWVGGFNGQVALKNTSATPWTSWSVRLTMPSGVTRVSSWGTYKLSTSGATVTFSNESWNGTLAPGATVALGFGGAGTLKAAPSNCQIAYNGGTFTACSAAGSTTPTPPKPTPTPTPTPTPVVLTDEPQTMSAAKSAITNQRVYVGYYPSWSDNWFSSLSATGAALGNDAIVKTSQMARIPAVYTHVMTAFAQPNFSYTRASNFVGNTWSGTGLNFNAGPKDIKRAIDVLHARGIKVVLAVGGASYSNWTALAAESLAAGPITTALKQIMLDVGFDGLDVDYELEGTSAARIAEYKGVINAMRRAVDLAGGQRLLTLAGWSVGADCTLQTGTSAAACGGKTSYWGGTAGRERLLFAQPGMAQKINMVNVMAYDARYEHFDGPKAWALYRDLFPSTTIVNLGLETSPEGWAGAVLVINDADALCTGSKILQDQFSTTVAQAYSVERYAKAPTLQRPTSNPRDGAMLWQILKTATATCGTSVVASPGTIASKLATLYGLQRDDRRAWK